MKSRALFGCFAALLLGMGVAGLAVESIAIINGMPIIRPDPAAAADWYDAQVAYNLYSPLVYPTPEGTIRPHLAESWEPVDGDLAHWRFWIGEGVKFHDGSELTAEDVAFSMNRFMAMGRGYSGVLGRVTAEVIGEYVVDFFLEEPNAAFPETLTLFWPLNKDLVLENIADGRYGEYGDYGEEWLRTNDAGTGPYKMVRHTPGEELEAVIFEDYFLGWDDPYWAENEDPIERLLFIMEHEYTTLLMLLERGELDLEANDGWTLAHRRTIDEDPRLRANEVWGQNVTVWLNTTRPPLDCPHFRRAIAYAYDYEAIIESYVPFGYTATGIMPPTFPGFVDGIVPQAQDMEKAREELALSKYADQLGQVVVRYHYCAGLTFQEDIGLQLQADLAALGIRAEVAGPPWPEYSESCATPETTPHMTVFLFGPQYLSPDYYLYGMFHPEGLGWIFSAHWFFEDERMLSLLEESRATLDFDARIALYEEIQRLIADHLLAFYPYYKPTVFVSQEYLVGPAETYDMIGPNINMHNWRIDLDLKQELRG